MHTKNWIQGHASVTTEHLQQDERKIPENLQETCWLIVHLAWSRGRTAAEMRYKKHSCAGCAGVVAHAFNTGRGRQSRQGARSPAFHRSAVHLNQVPMYFTY